MARSGGHVLLVAVLLLSGAAARSGGTEEAKGVRASEGDSGADDVFSMYKKLADERHTAAAIFRRLDTDKDGGVSTQEMRKHNKLNYAARVGYTLPASTIAVQADENADGRVSKREYATWYASRVETVRSQAMLWKKADKDRSGDLSYEEYKASDLYDGHADNAFGGCPADYNPGPADTLCREERSSADELAKDTFFRMDRNHDNKVSKAEYKAYYHADQHRAADRNGDGNVSLQEFLQAPHHYRGALDKSREEKQAEFKKADTNHDGKLSRKESEDALVRSRQAILYMQDPADDADEDLWTVATNPIIAGHDIDQPEMYPTSEESLANVAQPLEVNVVSGDAADDIVEVEGISEKDEKEELKSLYV